MLHVHDRDSGDCRLEKSREFFFGLLKHNSLCFAESVRRTCVEKLRGSRWHFVHLALCWASIG